MLRIDELFSQTTSEWWETLTSALQDDEGDLWLDLTCQRCSNPMQDPHSAIPDIVMVEPSQNDSISDIGFLHQDRHRQGRISSTLPPHLVIHCTQQRPQGVVNASMKHHASARENDSPRFMDVVRSFVRTSRFPVRVLLDSKEESAKRFSSNALVLEGKGQELDSDMVPLEGIIVTTTTKTTQAAASSQHSRHHHRGRHDRSRSRNRRRTLMYDGQIQHIRTTT